MGLDGWNRFVGPIPNPVENWDEYFLVSDGKKISIARWANLCSDNPDCGADCDEYEFKTGVYPYLEVKFWKGPLILPEM